MMNSIKNQKDYKYKKYFRNLSYSLKNLNNSFLYFNPDIYKKDLEKNKGKSNYGFFKNSFKKSFLLDNKNKIKNSQICFISHYVGNKISDKDLDFYYGNLFKNSKFKKSYFLILINHTNESLNEIKKKFNNSKISRVYINNSFNLFLDIRIVLKIIFEYLSFQIYKILNLDKYLKSIKIKQKFSFNYFFRSRFTYKISKRIIDILNISKNLNNLVITLEGHAFEKIIFNYCKERKIKSIGYYFSVIREYKNSIYYNYLKNYEPDMILTSGYIAQKDLKNNLPKKKILVLGGNKKFPKNSNLNISKNNKKKITVLVCPEGIYSETIKLFELINNKTLINNKFQFLFRVHPVLKDSDFFKRKLINSNIKFSNHNDIKEDFKKSDIILYSGSSVCVPAVMSGIIPLNYRVSNNEFSRDPLYKVNKFVVQNKNELKSKIILLTRPKKSLSIKHNMYKLMDYCDLYFTKLNHKVLNKALNN